VSAETPNSDIEYFYAGSNDAPTNPYATELDDDRG
jgi:hypothetical protein